MSDTSSSGYVTKPWILPVVITGVIVISLAMWLVVDNAASDTRPTPGTPHNQSTNGQEGRGTQEPDRVKESTNDPRDTTPSSDGTGPGSDRSLLGPNPQP